MFAVVEFTDKKFKGSCEIVLFSWISEDQRFCSCPPDSELEIAVATGKGPEICWNRYGVKVKYITGSKSKAESFLHKYFQTSNVETSDVSDAEGQFETKRRKPKKRRLPEYSYTLDSDHDESIPQKKALPCPPTVEYTIQSIDSDKVVLSPSPAISIYENNANLQFDQQHTSDIELNSHQPTGFNSGPWATTPIVTKPDFGGFENYVVRKLKEHSRLLKEQNQLLLQIQRKLEPGLHRSELQATDPILHDLPSLPISTVEEFINFEEKLTDEQVFLALLKHVASGGWQSVHDATYGALKILMSDSAACTFNWAGVNRKKDDLSAPATSAKAAFRSTKTKDLVFGAVRKMLSFAKDSEIEKLVKDWLKAAPSRHAKTSVVTQ